MVHMDYCLQFQVPYAAQAIKGWVALVVRAQVKLNEDLNAKPISADFVWTISTLNVIVPASCSEGRT